MAKYGDDSRAIRHLGAPEGSGGTGAYPDGQVAADDEGQLSFAFAADPRTGTVYVDFGEPVAWIGFTPDEAEAIGAKLVEMARRCRADRN